MATSEQAGVSKPPVADRLVHLVFGCNLSALVVALVCGALLAALELGLGAALGRWPEPARDWTIGGLMFVVGALTERWGYRPRVLFFPVWFVGLLMLVVFSFRDLGWWGFVPLVVALLGSLGWLGWTTEREEWRAAPASLEELKLALLADDEQHAWQQLAKALFVPSASDLTAEVCGHDRQVLALLLEHLGPRLEAAEREAVDRLDAALALAERGDVTRIDAKLFEAVRRLIEVRGKNT